MQFFFIFGNDGIDVIFSLTGNLLRMLFYRKKGEAQDTQGQMLMLERHQCMLWKKPRYASLQEQVYVLYYSKITMIFFRRNVSGL